MVLAVLKDIVKLLVGDAVYGLQLVQEVGDIS